MVFKDNNSNVPRIPLLKLKSNFPQLLLSSNYKLLMKKTVLRCLILSKIQITENYLTFVKIHKITIKISNINCESILCLSYKITFDSYDGFSKTKKTIKIVDG